MTYVYNKKYLRDLKIEYNYLKNFIYNKASATLRSSLLDSLKIIHNEILFCECSIQEFESKNKINQITIFDEGC